MTGDLVSKTTFTDFKDSTSHKLDEIHNDTASIKKILLGNGELGLVAKVLNVEQACKKCEDRNTNAEMQTAKEKSEENKLLEVLIKTIPYVIGALAGGGAGAGVSFFQ